MYHYTECGLDNIYLANGYNELETEYGKAFSVENSQDLHKAIGSRLIKCARPLTGKEIRFLRCELGFSQHRLAEILRTQEQTVARWEKGQTKMKWATEVVLRALYNEKVNNQDGNISQLLEELAVLDRQTAMEQIVFEKEEQWSEKAA